MKPSSYKAQDGCWNCAHNFVKRDEEDGNEWFCHVDGSVRPPCASVTMDEIPDVYDEVIDAWEKWADDHFVDPWGICRQHEATDG